MMHIKKKSAQYEALTVLHQRWMTMLAETIPAHARPETAQRCGIFIIAIIGICLVLLGIIRHIYPSVFQQSSLSDQDIIELVSILQQSSKIPPRNISYLIEEENTTKKITFTITVSPHQDIPSVQREIEKSLTDLGYPQSHRQVFVTQNIITIVISQ